MENKLYTVDKFVEDVMLKLHHVLNIGDTVKFTLRLYIPFKDNEEAFSRGFKNDIYVCTGNDIGEIDGVSSINDRLPKINFDVRIEGRK